MVKKGSDAIFKFCPIGGYCRPTIWGEFKKFIGKLQVRDHPTSEFLQNFWGEILEEVWKISQK